MFRARPVRTGLGAKSGREVTEKTKLKLKFVFLGVIATKTWGRTIVSLKKQQPSTADRLSCSALCPSRGFGSVQPPWRVGSDWAACIGARLPVHGATWEDVA